MLIGYIFAGVLGSFVNTTERNSLIISLLIIFVPVTLVAALSGASMFVLMIDIIFMGVFFPLPVADVGTVRYQTIPWFTIGIIIVNTFLLFVWQGFGELLITGDPTTYVQKVWTYGQREVYFEGYSIGAFTSITSVFMHADHTHLISNMIALWAFGKRLEDACGGFRYFVFYIVAGVIAGLGVVYLSPPFDGPGIGASGALFGVMGAYLILFPTSKIKCFWLPGLIFLRPLILFFGSQFDIPNYKQWRWLITLPSIVVLGLYVGYNLLETQAALSGEFVSNAGGKIAHTAGFLASILIFLFVRKDLLRRYLKGRNL